MKGGASIISNVAYCVDEHLKYLPPDDMPLVGGAFRAPRYVNKRCIDPLVKVFMDENAVEVPSEWGLPKPNADAAYISLAKYNKSEIPLSESQICNFNMAWLWTMTHFGVHMSDSRIVSLEESLASLDLTTSTGMPFNQVFSVKRDLLESDGEIREWLAMDWERMITDPTYTYIFSNSLKEEIRPAEKILTNSLRTFLAGSLDATVQGNRLFLDMNEKMYEAGKNHSVASMVGVSPYGGNWNIMIERLKVFKNGYALDESQYDSSLRSHLMWGCAWLRYHMLREEDRTPENMLRVQVYYRNLINTVVLSPDGVLLLKKLGNPSGSVNTITDNTLILYTLLAFAWLENCPEDFRVYSRFEQHTVKALVGDDNTWTVSDEAHVFFNARSVIETWRKIGVTTTTDSLEPRRAAELDFLSAHTTLLKGVYVPVYDRRKLMTSLLFVNKEKMQAAFTLERTAAMLRVGWTDPLFRKFCRSLIVWLLAHFDKTLHDDVDWMLAKGNIFADTVYESQFIGMTLQPQSLGGSVKLTQPNKSDMQASNTGNLSLVKRADRALKNVEREGLSPAGKAALIAALDPYHDEQIVNLNGWPDLSTEPSVIRTVNQQWSLDGFADGDTLILHHFPILHERAVYECVRNMNVFGKTGTVGLNLNTLVGVKYSAAAGGNFILPSGAMTQVLSGGLGSAFVDGKMRLIGLGIEVYDVTAELYKAGSITTYQMPQVDFEQPSGYQWVQAANSSSVDVRLVTKWPNNLALASTLKGTRTWDLKEGVYTVVGRGSHQNNPTLPLYEVPLMYSSASTFDNIDSANVSQVYAAWNTLATVNGQASQAVFQPNVYTDTTQKGIMCTGLTTNTKLLVKMIMHIETFPSIADVELSTLAKPSASFDPLALHLISEAFQELPIAVPVRENGMGDWFAEVVADVLPYASAIGMGIAPELAPAIGPLSGWMEKKLRSYIDKEKAAEAKKREKEKAKQQKFIAPPNNQGTQNLASRRKTTAKK